MANLPIPFLTKEDLTSGNPAFQSHRDGSPGNMSNSRQGIFSPRPFARDAPTLSRRAVRSSLARTTLGDRQWLGVCIACRCNASHFRLSESMVHRSAADTQDNHQDDEADAPHPRGDAGARRSAGADRRGLPGRELGADGAGAVRDAGDAHADDGGKKRGHGRMASS